MSKITGAHDISLEDYLKYPELRIPLFQRDYVWDVEEIEEFWNDLTQEGVQFLGSIILKDEHYDKVTKTGYLEIVDGQQRTISILILLATIARKLRVLAKARKHDYERNADAHAEAIFELISKRDQYDLTKALSYKLILPSPEDNVAIRGILDGTSIQDKKKYKNFSKVQEKLDFILESYLQDLGSSKKKIDALIHLKIGLLNIKVIEVMVPTDEDAYMIFEAVNDRGADLGAAELLKNYLFSKIKDNQKNIQSEWVNIKRTLNVINRPALDLTGFLRYYWISQYNHISKRALFKDIKAHLTPDKKSGKAVTSPEKILSEISAFRMTLEKIYMSDFDEWSTYFKDAVGAGDLRQNQRRAVEWFSYKKNLGYFPKSIQYLPIYAAIVGKIEKIKVSDKTFIELLLSIEKINFVYSYLLQEPTNKIDKLLSGIARAIFSEIEKDNADETKKAAQKGIAAIEKFLKESVKKSDVDAAIMALNWNKPADKAIIYFILINLEFVKGGYSRMLVREDLTLEHVYPKSVESKGKIKGWPTLDFDYESLGHGLGNLTLLPASGPHANGSAGEESFKIKRRDFLEPSVFSINSYFKKTEIWSGKNVQKRLKDIQKDVWEHWGPRR